MPFIPHTETDLREMLTAIGVESVEALFDEIPSGLRSGEFTGIPPGLTEMAMARRMRDRARQDGEAICFIGAGAYDHHIPAAVWQIASRGEFLTAYTPYQPEASQGTLQLLYEFQSMLVTLTGLDVANASLYDGASALAEAVLMAVRLCRSGARRVLMPQNLNPRYRQVVRTLVSGQGIELVELPFDPLGGHTDPSLLRHFNSQDIAALVIPQPNFFGVLEEVDALTAWARHQGVMTIALVNPVSLGLLRPPGEWDGSGVDIACGEGQPLGIPLSSGGPYLGFLCCRTAHIRQLPGRLVGRTLDRQGREGFVLTLQAREQHIRRAKATSNICTNQGLMATAAAIHMTLLGPEGLRRVAVACHAQTRRLVEALSALPGVAPVFNRPYFHECAISLPIPPAAALRLLAAHRILGGVTLEDYPEHPALAQAVLTCATELRTEDDIGQYQTHLARAIAAQVQPVCALRPKTT